MYRLVVAPNISGSIVVTVKRDRLPSEPLAVNTAILSEVFNRRSVRWRILSRTLNLPDNLYSKSRMFPSGNNYPYEMEIGDSGLELIQHYSQSSYQGNRVRKR